MAGSKDDVSVGAAALNWILGRNLVIGLASMVLLALSGFATYRGMSDFIIGIQTAPLSVQGAESHGIAAELLVLAIVAALTFLMWIALRETVRPQDLWKFFVTFPLYAFLFLWSVGFGYGFWWSLIAGSEATRLGLQGQAEDVRDAAVGISARLAAVQSRLDAVVRLSERQMEVEEASGGSCGVRSAPGRGPLWRARSTVRDGVDDLNNDIRTNWLASVEADLVGLNNQLANAGSAVEGATLEARQAAFEQMASEIRGSAQEIATRSDALGDAYAQEMRQFAASLLVRPGEDGFACYDPDLAARLNEAATDASTGAEVSLRAATFSEGAAGVAAAVTRLWDNVGRSLQSAVGMPVPPLDERDRPTGRDLTALLAAVGVDVGLFVLAILNPPLLGRGGQTAFGRNVANMTLPSPTVSEELARAFRIAIHNVPDLSYDKVRMHFIAHRGRAYLVTPNIYRCDESDNAEVRRGIAMNQVAGVLDEYGLVRPLSERQRKKFWQADPRRISESKLTPSDSEEVTKEIRDAMHDEVEKAWSMGGEAGLFAKSRRAMHAAGWSGQATLNPEIWEFIGSRGLTPLLMVLERASAPDQPPAPALIGSGASNVAALPARGSAPQIENKPDDA